ncbi:MAG TPA: aldolase/citrate lyase family protein [Dehalococcoidia bacterium]|nr:aldolase/citrate lyase family protein [Dehalococcoidia bacterium]MDP7261619.1 aldolase/citrate lyase family protein [Dehalococcoidia bacterium]MDP7485917.1 aldolase/citrate lyase family protein [Dehalococcoidia bacterium]HJP28569.1 aldolase/citrate lyase family protein [Dehalococcoidia bacterium]
MKKTTNVLRDRLNDGKPTIGTHLMSVWPAMVEIIGYTGVMDYIEFSGEDAPYDLASLDNFTRAIDLFDHMSSMMKIEQIPKEFLAGRANGAGIQNLLFADTRYAEDARSAVAAARPETPGSGGKAGAGWKREAGYGIGATLAEAVQQRQQGVVALMIEKVDAVENLEEILEVDGVDMIQFGPSDYSVTRGMQGDPGQPEIERVRRYVNDTAIKLGVRPRAEIFHFEEAKPYMDAGVIDFCIGWDTRTVYDFCKRQGEELAKLLSL